MSLTGDVRYDPAKSLWLVSMAGVAVIGGVQTWSWPAFAVFLASTAVVLLFGHSLGSHRKLVHESYGCPRWLARVFVWTGVQAGLDGPLGLASQHDLRDREQRLPGCHAYLRHGAGFARDAWWQLHCRLVPHGVTAPDGEVGLRPTAADPFVRWLQRTWRWQQLPPAIVLFAAGGWGFVVWGVAARITACVVGHWLVGWFAHNRGGSAWRVLGAGVQGRNVPFVLLLTMGEGWHNNHHAFPGSARLGLAPGEWDPGWWALIGLRRLGLVWNLRLPEHLPPRPELVRDDSRRKIESMQGAVAAR